MRIVWTILFLVFSIIGYLQNLNVNAYEANDNRDGDGEKDYLNHWVVEIEGGRDLAEEIAAQHGFVIDSQFLSIPNHYELKHSDVPHRSKRSAHHHTKRLSEDSRIKFVEQQHEKVRVKRGHLYNRDLASHIARSNGELNDPNYHDQWYLEDSSTDGVHHMRIKEAWAEGVTGRGVMVTILDDGIEGNHPDLAANYEPKASYDFNDNDPDPSPRYDITNENKHGTRCGGEIAMVANNGKCGVGVAFNARIGGVRMLDGRVTDRVEAESIGFAKNVDISSASWGPNDDGVTLEGPGRTAMKGINESITLGRGGKGSILVWAAGNGASYDDNCNCDGYTSDRHTLSVSSVSQHGQSPWYSEKCSSTLTATYSSGNRGDKKVVTADLRGLCTSQHTGTSAAAPMAAGILALVLEKNPELTWRDVQHLVVITSQIESLLGEAGWYKNGVGLCVNHAFGFGLIDALQLVKMAAIWQNVPEQKICRAAPNATSLPVTITSGNSVTVEIHTDGCEGQDQEIHSLEHIQVILTLDTTKRGNIYVEIESPSGTITPLMMERQKDNSNKGFQAWPLMSVHTWGEDPSGTWKLRVADRQTGESEKAELKKVELVLFGTNEKPFYHDKIDKEKCANFNKYPTMKKRRGKK